MRLTASLKIAAYLLLQGQAAAQDIGNYDFGLGVSTVGFTGEITYRVSERWRLRAMASGAPDYRKREEAGDILYDAIAEIRGLSLLADYTLGQSRFYLTGGAFISGNKVLGEANGNLLIGDTVYDTNISMTARFSNRVSPILALGYELPLSDRWHLNVSGGYIYTNGVEASISVIGGNPVDPDDLIEEADQIENEIGDGYPFVTLGLTYRF